MLTVAVVAIPLKSRPLTVAAAQSSWVMAAAGSFTVADTLHVCPPSDSANVAVPAEAGVPEMLSTRLPAPEATLPAAAVAVRPVTPVDASDMAL